MIFLINDENPTHIDSSIDYNEKVYQDILKSFFFVNLYIIYIITGKEKRK